MTCLITGCRLVIEAEGKSLWGDLHQQGSSFVFVGCQQERPPFVAWEYDDASVGSDGAVFLRGSGHEKRISLLGGAPYFERRGVVVFDPLHSSFNQLAREYLKES